MSLQKVREWNCQLNISANRWLLPNVGETCFIKPYGKTSRKELHLIWKEAQLYKSDWNRPCLPFLSPLISFHLSTLCSHTPAETYSLCCPQSLCLWSSSAALQLLLWASRNHWTLVIPLSSPSTGGNFCRSCMETVKCLISPKNSDLCKC